jgi:adenylate kinase family enzyme
VQRVSVVGTSGAGKSTVAAALAALLGASFLELDSVHHQADWTPLPRSEFRALVAAAAAGERWVIDGNYSSVQDIVWARADTVVWLDLPRRTVMRRVIWRTLRRIGGRVELWNGNRERWRNLFSLDKEESIIAWAWQTHAANRARYEADMADPNHGHLRFVRLCSAASVRQFLQSVEAASAEPVPGSGWPLSATSGKSSGLVTPSVASGIVAAGSSPGKRRGTGRGRVLAVREPAGSAAASGE